MIYSWSRLLLCQFLTWSAKWASCSPGAHATQCYVSWKQGRTQLETIAAALQRQVSRRMAFPQPLCLQLQADGAITVVHLRIPRAVDGSHCQHNVDGGGRYSRRVHLGLRVSSSVASARQARQTQGGGPSDAFLQQMALCSECHPPPMQRRRLHSQ